MNFWVDGGHPVAIFQPENCRVYKFKRSLYLKESFLLHTDANDHNKVSISML